MCFVNTDSWEIAHAKRVGKAVQELRTGQGSAAWLSARTEQLGLKMSRQTITDLENGRRRYVTTAELLVLAAALNTAPVALIFAGDYDAASEVLPGYAPTNINAAQWFSGFGTGIRSSIEPANSGSAGAEEARRRAQYRDNTFELRTYRRIEELQERLDSVVVPRGGSLTDRQRDDIDYYENQIEQLRQDLSARNA